MGDDNFRENLAKIFDLRSSKQHRDKRSLPRFRPPWRLKALLLHVWIEWIIMVWLREVVAGEDPGGVG